jgi:archaeosine synthase beta-subunit
MNLPYPESAQERDRWILSRRAGIPRDPALNPFQASHWLRETEPDAAGKATSILTVFLANRECPWRCLMCDLWRHTLEETVPTGAITAQVDQTLLADGAIHAAPAEWLKLYNAGSFFDPGAIPAADWDAIAARARRFSRLVVECHPTLVGERILPFRDLLGSPTRLEVALGLETAHPGVLGKLNKRITTDGFARAAAYLKGHGMDLRVFILVKPPFLDEAESLHWACRSTEFAFDCGADVVSLIPTRSGNGALEALSASGDFSPPRPETLEAALRHGLSLGRGRVFADTWDLGRLGAGRADTREFQTRLEAMNLAQGLAD